MCVCVCVFVSLFCWDLPKESIAEDLSDTQEKNGIAATETARETRARKRTLTPINRNRETTTRKVTKSKRSQNNATKSKPISNKLNKKKKK